MLEGLAAWVINNYLGKYVENLNTDQLSIALLQGAVELENLPLKKDALRQVGLPIHVRAGVIGKVKLKIPVSQITTAPWEVLMEQLYLVAGPIRPSDMDDEAEEQAEQDYKLSRLDAVEARWRAETEQASQEASYYASSYSSWLGLSMSFATNIIENLQLRIKDVHFRFEDDVTGVGEGNRSYWAGGVRIESLAAQSCDNAWTPKFMSSYSTHESFKLLEMSGFSVYWDHVTKEELWGDFDLANLTAAMSITRVLRCKHEYLLSPVNAVAHLKRNRSEQPLRSKNQPRIVCDLKLDQVPLSLIQWQYRAIVGCARGLCTLSQWHQGGRPPRGSKSAARKWWKYAITRLVPPPKPTWQNALERARQNIAYVKLYSRLLVNPASPLSPDDKTFKDKIEWERDFDELNALRQCAMSRVRPPSLAGQVGQRQGVNILVSWFPQWWGWQTAAATPPGCAEPAPDSSLAAPELTTASSIEDQILDVLADTVENNTLLRRDTVFGQFNFTLKQGTFNLCGDSRKPMMELGFENVKLGFESRPRTGSHCVSVTLGGLFLRDHLSTDSAFPVLISPQRYDTAPLGRPGRNLPPGMAKLLNSQSPSSTLGSAEQPLFQLSYEYKPFNSSVDYRLQVHSKSLDVVYNPGATKWIVDFFTGPAVEKTNTGETSDGGLRQAARQGYHAVKRRTKQQLLNNWEGLLRGYQTNRKVWDVELDISAPQIFLVEHFNDKNAVLCVIDFGRLRLTNRSEELATPLKTGGSTEEEEEDEAFQTPCSTPPGSEASDSLPLGSPQNSPLDPTALSEKLLHNKIYDMYTVELCDLQILVGRVKDNWKFAHLKGTSTLHVLDRFNISLQVERRVVFTMDPQFPSLTVSGNLPKLVAHVNEQKVHALRTLLDIVSGKGLISPLRSQESTPVSEYTADPRLDTEFENSEADEHPDTGAKLLMLQFSVDQMALEVQSRGRSVAELQVNGVKLSFMKRPFDTSLSLSVHGLLLVDALQTFGPDFELLVASHKHVGMDSVSGSLQDSEPTSPVSPASPDPEHQRPSPIAITQALSTLKLDPSRAKTPVGKVPSPPKIKVASEVIDSEALITVELLFVSADCPTNGDNSEHIQIANIQFNNLDIIANQETIVELLAFVRRVFPQSKTQSHIIPNIQPQTMNTGSDEKIGNFEGSISGIIPTRTQLTFDFHRLNVLLLRAIIKDSGALFGKKIATATMTEAKVHANIGASLEVEGSLGGLQVVDLTPEGGMHQRTLSLGEDPLTAPLPTQQQSNSALLAAMTARLYRLPLEPISTTNQAFSFSIKRSPITHDTDVAEITVRLASVWYTHSPHLLYELQSCAEEFKQYLSNLARSISSAATEMAIGLVHTRTESLAHSLSMGGRLYGSLSDVSQTPRKRMSCSTETIDFYGINTKGTNTPHSPADQSPCKTLVKWDVVLASPVVVLPRKSFSTQVSVAHLGSISVTNSQSGQSPASSPWSPTNPFSCQRYSIQIRDINLYTLDIKDRIISTTSSGETSLMPAEGLYKCGSEGKPVLHDTSIQLSVIRDTGRICLKHQEELFFESGPDIIQVEQQETLQVNGKMVTALKLSLSRGQYEQLLETFETCLGNEDLARGSGGLDGRGGSMLSSLVEEEHEDDGMRVDAPEMNTGVSTLSMDPALRARMMIQAKAPIPMKKKPEPPSTTAITVSFEMPVLTVELIADLGVGEEGLVDLTFKELIIQYDKSHSLETNIQVSLRWLLMEDLQKAVGSRHRCIVVSSSQSSTLSAFVSRSCPDLSSPPFIHDPHSWHNSLPDHLEAEHVLGAMSSKHHYMRGEHSGSRSNKDVPPCPYTPPPSPRGKMTPSVFNEDNLVHVNIITRPPAEPNQVATRHTTVDFNSLDVIVNVESWIVVLDFFGISDIDQESAIDTPSTQENPMKKQEKTSGEEVQNVMEISIRCLSAMLNRAEYEVARAGISHLTAKLVNLPGPKLSSEVSIGSLSLVDLTPIHGSLYRERFTTMGLNISMNKYSTPDPKLKRSYDIQLKMDMSSVVYVHTQRFVTELQSFFRLFPHLRRRIGYSKGNVVLDDENTVSTRLLLELYAASPIILLPMSSQSSSVLVVDLGKLTVKNKILMSGSPGSLSVSSNPDKDVLLDVMSIELESMDVLRGERYSESKTDPSSIPLGGYCVQRMGTSLLRETCHLQLHVERNLMDNAHFVPDLSIHGTLSTLAATLNLEDYKVINGLLSFNIGECLDDLVVAQGQPVNLEEKLSDSDDVWTCFSMNLELVDVSVCMTSGSVQLACINFVKSRLVVENYSNRTQDVDLISQEILITDTRFQDEPANKRSNVFTNILQPIHSSNETDTVQAQVHHRKRLDLSKFTILLNNMRLMAILDWWELVRDFIMTKSDNVHPVQPINNQMQSHTYESVPINDNEVPFELKLNITDSEIVVVEDTSQWDSNAVILKSTTVFTYRPVQIDKPISCNLNHCEMFSCLLGMEDETALSIIDPVTINMDIVCRQTLQGELIKTLKVQMVHLSLRLSYHDMRMFSQMLESLPHQTQSAKSNPVEEHPANFQSQLEKLKSLGFQMEDCCEALNKCGGHLDDAALWLTQNAIPAGTVISHSGSPIHQSTQSPFTFNHLEIDTDGVSLCVIDDCGDADVPLVEFAITRLKLNHGLDDKSGSAQASTTAHYYNRLLSGWEPFMEPWSCNICWDRCLSSSLSRTRMEWHIASADSLDLNITSSLIELYRTVKESWTQDYYNPRDNLSIRGDDDDSKSPPGYRRRSPFVPFAIKNDTGSILWFITKVNTGDSVSDQSSSDQLDDNENWIFVEPGSTLPFSFNEQGKLRHIETHKPRTHQIVVKAEGWYPVTPVTIDRVGVFFRQAHPDLHSSEADLPQAKLVLEVTLEGSARKLVTVRSALQIFNRLPHTVEIKLDNTHLQKGIALHLTVPSDGKLAVPLVYGQAKLWARPLQASGISQHHAFCARSIMWHHVTMPNDTVHETRTCAIQGNRTYRFCVSVKRENYPVDRMPLMASSLNNLWMQPAHSITLLSPLTVINLLPYELHYCLKDGSIGRLKAGSHANIHEVDLSKPLEINFHLDNFPRPGTLVIPVNSFNFTTRLRLCDQSNRRLYLQARITGTIGAALEVSIFAPFWILNKTALPLVFRQEGVATETAGQYEEHEVARMVAPLLFSFADYDASPTVMARVGSGVHPEGIPQWCRHFTLGAGVQVRRLKVSLRDNRPDLVYIVGIEIRPGRGRYRSTHVVTLSAYYQIHNKSSYRLQFAQKCFATTVNDPGATTTYLTAVPNCSLPFHWPRLDKDQLLCLRLLDVPQCLWSGGFRIDDNNSFHLNIRDTNGRMYFLRIEIVLQGATFFIVLTDADTMPPPIRVDNFSQVSLQFHQAGLTGQWCKVRPHSCIPYAWDESTLPPSLTLTAPGGVSANYNLNRLGDGPGLTYENFIYITFTGTFKNGGSDVEKQQLVLDVPEPGYGRVVLSRKQDGARSQLWRMTAEGQLQHEGSSPPRAPPDKIMVLDICGPAPQPSQYVGLTVRRPDKRRTSTQSWRFTTDGRLCCAHNNMCVQAKDGFFGLRKGSEAVLGPPQPETYQTTDDGLPLEQAVSRQRLRPGSGFLAVTITTDGPTRVVQVTDIKEKRKFATIDESAWMNVHCSRPALNSEDTSPVHTGVREVQIAIDLPCVGISLVSQRPPEELVYLRLSGIRINMLYSQTAEMLEASIQDLQVDNQLFEAQSPVMLYVTPNTWSTEPEEAARPALNISAERTLTKHTYNADIYKHLLVRMKNMSLIVDERLVLKLFAFAGWDTEEESESADESDFETQRILAEASSVHAKRYYYGSLILVFTQVRLSVLTSNKLSDHLAGIKRKLGMTLVKFEDAAVELEPFTRRHVFENSQFLMNLILKHYKNELKSQGAIILGSVDFLGNPLGLINDFNEGVTGLIYEGNVGALVKNVTHGLSNSAAKFTESLGDGLGRVILDDAHEEMRQRIKSQTGNTGDHIVAGLKGFSFGLLGGVTSVFKQTYDGATSDGIQGFISGLGKGLVGTVTKPVVGVLDLATETASAVRDSSRSSSRLSPGRKRLPRCVTSPTGLLPLYARKQSQGQQFLYVINKRNYAELFMAYEVLRSGSEDLRVVISSENVRVFSCNLAANVNSVIFEKQLNDLNFCTPLRIHGSNGETLHYIEFTMRFDGSQGCGLVEVETKRPKVRCDSENIASWVSHQVNYAKARCVERQHTLFSASDSLLEEST